MPEKQTASAALSTEYQPDLIVWRFIRDLVRAAYDIGKEAPVMKHLSGAILHLIFPAAVTDDPTPRTEGKTAPLGDYLVGDTVFCIIPSPVMEVYDRCKENLEQGFQAFLLVPDKYFCGTRQNAEIILPGKIMVASIESFVSQNIEHLAGFAKDKMAKVIKELLGSYNRRVMALENDESLLIAVPGNL